LANWPCRGAKSALGAVDRFALGKVELVKRTAASHAPVSAELDPLRVGYAFTDVYGDPHVSAAMVERARKAGVRLV